MLQMSELRTNCKHLHTKFTQLRNVPNQVNSLFSTLFELYVCLMLFYVKFFVVLSLWWRTQYVYFILCGTLYVYFNIL